ncbi:hypothetical protein Tco_0708620 [Tanacetum coccineum]
MLRVFPITLKGPALRWINRLSAGLVTTWDLLEKAFIKQYCPPFKNVQEIRNNPKFQTRDGRDIVSCLGKGLDIPTRRVLDSKGFIPLMTPTQALISTQVMVEHSYNWYDETTTREEINDSLNNIDTQKPKKILCHSSKFQDCKGGTYNHGVLLSKKRTRHSHHTTHDWFNNTSEDEDDLEGILDYLKPRSYDGFINFDNEAYNKKRCRLLGMTYEEPTPILIEKTKVTRYTVGLGETYAKFKVLGVEKIPRTRDNVAAMRARLMKKMTQ